MFVALALLYGCAIKHVQVRAEVVIKRECMEAVELSEKAECRGTPDGMLHCSGFVLTKKKGCEVLEVQSKEKK